MLDIEKEFHEKLEKDYKSEERYYDLTHDRNAKTGEVTVIAGLKFTIVDASFHWENVDLESCSGDRVYTIIVHINDDRDTFYKITTYYNSWDGGETKPWEIVKPSEKSITIWEKV